MANAGDKMGNASDSKEGRRSEDEERRIQEMFEK